MTVGVDDVYTVKSLQRYEKICTYMLTRVFFSF